ncbi:hypothetical protein [Nesterenkonia suensis]
MSETTETPEATEHAEEHQQEPATTPEAVQDHTDPVDASVDHTDGDQDDAPEDDDTDPRVSKLRQESKRYRQRLRDAEAQRDHLQQQLQAARGENVTSALTAALDGRAVIRPSDVYMLTSTTAEDYVTEDGTTDTDAIETTVSELLQQRPELAERSTRFDSARGKQRSSSPEKQTMADAFRPPENRQS